MHKFIGLTAAWIGVIIFLMQPALSKPSHTPIDSLHSIADRYDIYLVDVIGVMHDGIQPFTASVNCINQLIQNGKTIIFLSNNPRPGTLMREKLISFGIQPSFDIVTSGDVARKLLAHDLKGKKIFHFGAERNKDITQNLTLNIVDHLDKAEVVLLTAFLEPDEQLADLEPMIQNMAQSKLPIYCANPDKSAMHGNNIRLCAGTIAERIIAKGGKVYFTGKPDPMIFENLSSFFPKVKFQKRKMLMIGDSLDTDIQGAEAFGIDSLLVLSGNAGKTLDRQGVGLSEYLEKEKIAPTFYMDALRYEP